jgi:hypothetical protein
MEGAVLDPSAESDTDVLSRGEMQIVGHFVHGSNYTFLANLKLGSRQVQAVYKPIRGENPLWDFPNRTLAKREVAAFELSEWLGWHLVPPTVFRRSASLGAGSLQLFIEHDPNRHYFTLTQSEIQLLKPVALFDVIVNNADRKGSHLIFDSLDRMWCIDHGLCFNREEKLRTVIWDFAGEPIPLSLLEDLSRARAPLIRDGELFNRLHSYLSIAEIQALEKRISAVIAAPYFPFLPPGRRAIPYPPL